MLCDVVPMKDTHILLGRPWQFDKQSLQPLSPQEVNKDRNIIKKDKGEKENGQAFTEVLLAYKKNSSKARCASLFLLFPSQKERPKAQAREEEYSRK